MTHDENVYEMTPRERSGYKFTTWNPVTGCAKISPACERCYAERIALRLHRDGNPRYENGFQLTLHDDLITKPLQWRLPHLVFLASMADLFHSDVPDDYLRHLFSTMNMAHQHIFLVLTKRAKRLAAFAPSVRWTSNIWMGVTVEREDYAWRVRYLREVPARVRFLSAEPLLGPIRRLPLDGIQWVWTGGETGPNARITRPEWVRLLRDQCVERGVAFRFHRWGNDPGRLLDGRTWDEMPPLPPLREELQLAAF